MNSTRLLSRRKNKPASLPGIRKLHREIVFCNFFDDLQDPKSVECDGVTFWKEKKKKKRHLGKEQKDVVSEGNACRKIS